MDEAHEALARDSDAYFLRNQESIGTASDGLTRALALVHGVTPIRRLLEVGCSNGWRLSDAMNKFGCLAVGVEAGHEAVRDGRRRYPGVDLHQGMAPAILKSLTDREPFDCIVLGFFTYLLPREDLFHLAANIDELLTSGGHLVVHDFLFTTAVQSPYAHSRDLRTYKMDPSSPWTWSPTYTLIHRDVYDVPDPSALLSPCSWVVVDVARKLPSDVAYPMIAQMPSIHEKL